VAESVIDRVPLHRSARKAIVNVCAVPPVLLKVTLKNSGSARFVPANVMVPPVAESKTTVAVPAAQPAASVEAFVHVPLTVHVSEPKEIAEAVDEMFTAPVMVTAPDVLVKSPPLIVRLPADVMANVDLANVPPEIVKAFVTTTALPRVDVPADTVSWSNVLSVERSVIVAVASNATRLVPCVYTEPTPLVFQLPLTVHAPVVTVIVPDAPPVIVTPLMSTVEAFAVRMPALPTTMSAASAAAPRARSADANAVVETVSETVSVVSHRRPRVAMVKVCTVPALEVNVTELNSASARFAPANVIVPATAASKVAVAVPASHDALVVAFVHVPPKFQFALPKSMYEPIAEMFTFPSMSPMHAATPHSIAPPDIVRIPVAVNPVPADAPIVTRSCETASVMAPLTAKLSVPTASVLLASLNPVSLKLAIAAFTSTVIVQAATQDAASTVTAFALVGTSQPLAPPLESDHLAVLLQLPVPPTQNRAAPHPTGASSMAIASAAAQPAALDNVTTVPTEV
jgi:hypothetical protein